MEEISRELAVYLLERLKEVDSTQRLLVGLAGIPASGKSTLAHLVVSECNRLLHERNDEDIQSPAVEAILVGLDGWHFTRARLDEFPDPKLAHDRRGAHWTFDGQAYADFVGKLRIPLSTTTGGSAPADSHLMITGPSFDHALKDPSPGAVRILPRHRVVVIEGLYVFLSVEPWKRAGELLDERWLLELDPKEATRRLVERHVVTGVAKDMEEAEWRADENDMPNGEFLLANLLEPTRRIRSVEDPTLFP